MTPPPSIMAGPLTGNKQPAPNCRSKVIIYVITTAAHCSQPAPLQED